MSYMPEFIYAKDLMHSFGGWWVRKPNHGAKEYISAEKTKADKLATIEDVVTYCFAYLVDNYESNFEGGENQLAIIAHNVFETYKKQRIEAE